MIRDSETLTFLVVASRIFSVGTSVCALVLLIQMCLRRRWGMAIACAATCGFGFMYFYGLATMEEWNNEPMMLSWTLCILGFIATFVALYIYLGAPLWPRVG